MSVLKDYNISVKEYKKKSWKEKLKNKNYHRVRASGKWQINTSRYLEAADYMKYKKLSFMEWLIFFGE